MEESESWDAVARGLEEGKLTSESLAFLEVNDKGKLFLVRLQDEIEAVSLIREASGT